MTKKDYQLIADVLHRHGLIYPDHRTAISTIAAELCLPFTEDNPRFSPATFNKAVHHGWTDDE